MTRPRLLDLFCGAGGCSVGYHRAGFDVVGVDHVKQPDYPFEFHQGDAMNVPDDFLRRFDAIHASPPCKAFSALRTIEDWRPPRLFPIHVDLLTPMLARLHVLEETWGGIWVVENVPGAPMPSGAVTLCGSMFGLRVRRHRLFASNVALSAPPCRHSEQGKVEGVYGHGGGFLRGGVPSLYGAKAAAALCVDWTTRQAGLAQAIPPAYTELLGRQLIAHLAAGPSPVVVGEGGGESFPVEVGR